MTQAKARNLLTGTFLLSLALEAGIVFSSLLLGSIGTNDVSRLLTELLSIYSVHFAVILGFQFSGQMRHGDALGSRSLQNVWLAMLLVGLWNLLILSRFVIFLMAAMDADRSDSVRSLIDFTEVIAHSGSFLVAGVLAFFFGKSREPEDSLA